ncbi:hypothetical protein GCM10023321_43480 [Pseudonocardia eucalypti]|uniref:HTTM domain-containing protein n=1 Tax=Pseudonocardia eucalypti TaxID=648755 RepID=A0ABP9QFA6_9PSEU|nr:hypothetical protein [Pseudonocardia eucalypti]
MTSTSAVPTPDYRPKPVARAVETVEGPDEIGAREQLRWFITLWVMALAAHYTDNDPLGVLTVLAYGLPALAYPASPWAFGLLIAGAGVTGAVAWPTAANHKVVSLFIALGFASAALYVWATRDRPGTSGSFLVRWLAASRAPVAITLLVVYAFTVFHKLNTAFLDPAVSCAGHLLGQLIKYNGLPITVAPSVVLASAYGTLAVETTILVLLALPRTRRWGLLLGVGFHLVLAPASFWDFATMVFALYVLFVPTRVFAELAPRSDNVRAIALAGFGMHLVVATAVSAVGAVGFFGVRWHTVIVLCWYVAVIPMMAQLLRACFADRERWTGWSPRPGVLLVVPLLVFVTGASPYLGLKTVSNFSMFSNLHTEPGVANHLLPGISALQVLPYERDPVTITDIELSADLTNVTVTQPRWAREKPPITVPWQELRRIVTIWREAGVETVRLEFIRGGVPHSVPNALADPELAAPMPWWQRNLLAYRAVSSADGSDICRW